MKRIRLIYHYAYRIERKATGHYYIGIRTCECEPEQDRYWGSGVLVRRAFAKYGPAAFVREVLELFNSRKEASDYERQVVTLDMLADPFCMNLMPGGGTSCTGHKGRRHSLATRLKLSHAARGRRTKRQRNIMSLAQRKRWSSALERAAQSKRLKGKPRSTPMRAETRAKLSIALRGRKKSDVAKQAMRVAALRRWLRVRASKKEVL